MGHSRKYPFIPQKKTKLQLSIPSEYNNEIW